MAWDNVDEDLRNQCVKYIENLDSDHVRIWVRANLPIESMPRNQIREMAKEARVFNYSRLKKHELVRELKALTDENKKETNTGRTTN